jgi:hypothetical protein
MGIMEVNSWSNCEVSNEPATRGVHGGAMRPASRATQSVPMKNGCSLISEASLSPDPSRSLGLTTSSRESRSFAF